jgi:hypothetical protein
MNSRWGNIIEMENEASDEIMMFPEVNGENLLNENVSIPAQLGGKLNIVIVAFQQWHQSLVDSWVPYLLSMKERFPEIEFYELPTIRKMNFLYRSFINSGMRAGIPSEQTRRRTITLYIDKMPFKRDLQIPNEDNIHIFLIDKEGQIFWRSKGPFNEEKGQSLLETSQSLI